MVKEKGAKKVCAIYQDDEFGLEVLRGAEAGLKTINMELHREDQLQARRDRLLFAGGAHEGRVCDMVVLGTIIRETIGTIGESRKTGFNPVFIGSSAAYTDLIHKLGGKAMDGLYATMTAANPYTRRRIADGALLGQQVQDQVQRGPDRVLGVRLPDRSTPSQRRRRRPAAT